MIYTITTLAADTPVAPEAISGSQYLSALIGVVIPIAVALVTKHATSAKVKSLLLLVLSVVSGFLTELLNNANFVLEQAAFGAVLAFVTGTAALFGLWKPTGVDDSLKKVGDSTHP